MTTTLDPNRPNTLPRRLRRASLASRIAAWFGITRTPPEPRRARPDAWLAVTHGDLRPGAPVDVYEVGRAAAPRRSPRHRTHAVPDTDRVMTDPRRIVATPAEHRRQVRDLWLSIAAVAVTAAMLAAVCWPHLTTP